MTLKAMPTSHVSSHVAAPLNMFRPEDLEMQRAFFAERPHLAPTPLRECVNLARHLGVGELWVKDETSRFGLNAFKAAGAMFAVSTLIDRGSIRAGDTLVCASEGNHGRAVARAAREAGCPARVYLSRHVAAARVEAIESEGATIISVDGTYDDAVRQMAAEATARGWVIVSDTSWDGYTEIPWLIMLGYTRILDEMHDALTTTAQSETPLDCLFVPAGVGGLLAAAACWCDLRYGPLRPRVAAVEPRSAACVQTSVRAGAPTVVGGPFDTVMGGLRCGEMSPAVFPAVRTLVDVFIGIEDEFTFEAMRLLARPLAPDPVIQSGPSGAAALGGLLAVVTEPALSATKTHLGLGPQTRCVLITTEGVTDPAVFAAALARH